MDAQVPAPPHSAAERILAVDGLADARDLGGIPRRGWRQSLTD